MSERSSRVRGIRIGRRSWPGARPGGRLLAAIALAACSMGAVAAPARAGWATLPNAPIAPPDHARHDDVFFVGPDSGWVVNGGGQIHRTTDGGQSWTLQTTVPTYLRAVGFATRLKGWAGALYGTPLLYATVNAGTTWTPVLNIPDPRPNGICGLSVVSDSVVYGCGRYDGPPAVMIKTTDGGATWTSRDMAGYATSLIDCHFLDKNHGFAVGGTGSPAQRHAVILSTQDGGVTWQTRYTGNRPGAEWCWKISFVTPTTGYVSIERQDGVAATYVLRTTNAGLNWTEIPFVDDYDEQGIGFITPGIGWVGGWSGDTYETLDGGETWHLAGFGFYANRFRFLSPTLGYAVGERVYKYTADVAGVDGEPGKTPALTLGPNRPNPVTHGTRIPFSLGAEAHVRVTIHDVQGRTLRTLFDGIRPAGPTDLTWDARDCNGIRVGAGVYWCHVETPTGTAETKLVVIR